MEVFGVEFPVTLNLYDLTGRVIEKAIIYNHYPVTIGADLNPGVYFINVKGFKSKKLIKLR